MSSFLSNFDCFFGQSVILRQRKTTSYSTKTAGLWTILVFVVAIGMTVKTFLSIIHKERLHSTTIKIFQQNPYPYVGTTSSDIMFAIGITDVDLNRGRRYFDITLEKIFKTKNKTSQPIPLRKCQQKEWADFAQEQKFQSLHFQQWLCPPPNITINMSGKFTSNIFQYYQITVHNCSETLDPNRPCVGKQVINNYTSVNSTFKFKYYFINSMLNLQSSNPISRYLDDYTYLNFRPQLGAQCNIYISNYSIRTEESIIPLTNPVIRQGSFVNRQQQSSEKGNYLPSQLKGEYVRFYLRKSDIFIKSQRYYDKLDEALSNFGGLLTLLISASFIIGKYNKTAFELEMAKQLFYDKQGKNKQYYPYINQIFLRSVIIKSVFGPKYCITKTLHNCIKKPHSYDILQQIRQQLNLALMMRKIMFLENVSKHTVDPLYLYFIRLQRPQSLKDAKRERQLYQLHNFIENRYEKQNKLSRKQQEQNRQHQQKFYSKVSELKSQKQILRDKQLENRLEMFQNHKKLMRVNEQMGQKIKAKIPPQVSKYIGEENNFIQDDSQHLKSQYRRLK